MRLIVVVAVFVKIVVVFLGCCCHCFVAVVVVEVGSPGYHTSRILALMQIPTDRTDGELQPCVARCPPSGFFSP